MKSLSLLINCVIVLALVVNHDTMAIDNFAIEFKGDGKTRVIAPDSNSLDITGDLTMEAWVFPTATSGSAIIVNKENSWECALQSNILKAVSRLPSGPGTVVVKSHSINGLLSLSPLVKRSIIHLSTVSMRLQEQTRARSSLLMRPFMSVGDRVATMSHLPGLSTR